MHAFLHADAGFIKILSIPMYCSLILDNPCFWPSVKGLDKLSEGHFKFPLNLTGKSTMAF